MSNSYVGFSCVQLFVTLWSIAYQAPLPVGFSWQGYWNGLPCPPRRDLPDLGVEPMSLRSLALAGRFVTTSATWVGSSQIPWLLKQVTNTDIIGSTFSLQEQLRCSTWAHRGMWAPHASWHQLSLSGQEDPHHGQTLENFRRTEAASDRLRGMGLELPKKSFCSPFMVHSDPLSGHGFGDGDRTGKRAIWTQ